MRVVDEEGNNLGVLPFSKAIEMPHERELDLNRSFPKCPAALRSNYFLRQIPVSGTKKTKTS